MKTDVRSQKERHAPGVEAWRERPRRVVGHRGHSRGRRWNTDRGHQAASLIVVFRRYDQSTSGRKSSHRTSPAVAFSISGQCSAGTLFRRSQLLITCGAHSIRLANALCDPRWLIAFCSAVMRNILNTCLGNVNTWGLYHSTKVVTCHDEHGQTH